MSNPFESIDAAVETIAHHLGYQLQPTVVMEVSLVEQKLLSGGWSVVQNDRWKHVDAPPGECMSAFFALRVQRHMDRYVEEKRAFEHYSNYAVAVAEEHFDSFTD